jgi:hypothetical protein
VRRAPNLPRVSRGEGGMIKILRDNAAIVVGLALPFLVVLFFVLATALPKAYVDPPRHDVLLISENGPASARPVRVDVRTDDGRLSVRAYKLDASFPPGAYWHATPRLFIWSHETRSIREISFDVPNDEVIPPEGTEIAVPEIGARRLHTDTLAPDGYRFLTADGSGLFELFFDRNGSRLIVEKDGAIEDVSPPEPYWGTRFLGWVVE